MPHLVARSIRENVAGIMDSAALVSFLSSSRRMARIWLRRRDLRTWLIAVRRSVMRTRFREETVLAIYVTALRLARPGRVCQTAAILDSETPAALQSAS